VRTAFTSTDTAPCQSYIPHCGAQTATVILLPPPKAAIATAVVVDGGIEVSGVEVRPELVREMELCVCKVPQHEVAQALLAAGPTHKSIKRYIHFVFF
jgi:hypothetical protein